MFISLCCCHDFSPGIGCTLEQGAQSIHFFLKLLLAGYLLTAMRKVANPAPSLSCSKQVKPMVGLPGHSLTHPVSQENPTSLCPTSGRCLLEPSPQPLHGFHYSPRVWRPMRRHSSDCSRPYAVRATRARAESSDLTHGSAPRGEGKCQQAVMGPMPHCW